MGMKKVEVMNSSGDWRIDVLSGPVGLCNEPGPPVSLAGGCYGTCGYTQRLFSLARLLHVNCLPVTEFGPFRWLTAAVTLCSAAFLCCLFISQQPLFL